MSRAIHKQRGSRPPIEIIATDAANVLNSDDLVDFTGISVGAQEFGKVLIVALSHASDESGSIDITAITADLGGQNIAMTEVMEEVEGSSDTNRAAIYIANISAVTASTITIRCNATGTSSSWGISTLTVRNLISQTPTDSSGGQIASGTTTSTDATVVGQNGGLAVGAYCNDRRGSITVSWNNLTEKADLETGGGGHDHTHSAAWDLLPIGRSAAIETVTNTNGDNASLIVVAAFR